MTTTPAIHRIALDWHYGHALTTTEHELNVLRGLDLPLTSGYARTDAIHIARIIPGLRAARLIDREVGNYSVTDRFTKRHAQALACGRALDRTRYLTELDVGPEALTYDLGLDRPHVPITDAELDLIERLVDQATGIEAKAELLRRTRLALVHVAEALLVHLDR